LRDRRRSLEQGTIDASQYTLEEMKAIVGKRIAWVGKVAAHAHGAQGVQLASEAGSGFIEHGHLMDDASIATLKKNGPTWYRTCI